MNKTLLFLLSVSMLIGCKSERKSNENQTAETEQTLPQFENVEEMLAAAYEYSEKDGSFKFISEDKSNLHIQVSKPILETDLENVKEEIVKRDIIYVAFQSFAQTDIKNLTITAVPNDLENRDKYYNNRKKTVTVDREKAKLILKKYLNSEDFSILYKKSGKVWVPNKNFNELKFDKLNEVYAELTN